MKRILILMTLCLLLSCERDIASPEANLNSLITVEPSFWELYNGKRFYFVTNLDGELLAYKQINDQGLNILYTENDIIPEKFNVHRLYVTNDYDIRFLESFYNTSQTFFTSKSDCESLPDTTGDCSIHVTGPTYESYLISYPSGSYNSTMAYPNYLIDRTVETNLYHEYNFLYTFLKKDQQYYYKYFFDLVPNETNFFELNPETMSTNFDIKVLNAPEAMSFLDHSEIREVIFGGLCHNYTCKLFSEINSDSSTISIFDTPINPGKDYKSSIHLQAEGNKEYIFEKKGNLPEFIPTLDFDISSSSMDFNDILITCTGSFDFISGNYRGGNNFRNWSFYSDNPDLIKFPDFPAEITELFPNITGSSFFETSPVQGNISLNEYSNIENYSELLSDFELNRYLGENSVWQKLTIKNY